MLNGINSILLYKTCDLEKGFKYLGYFLKPNEYKVQDWHWLLEKFGKRIQNWTFRLLSIGGRLTLVKAVLINIPVYWFSLLQVPSSILNILRRYIINFLWTGGTKKWNLVMVSWENLSLPKEWGGWGLKNIFWFNSALRLESF